MLQNKCWPFKKSDGDMFSKIDWKTAFLTLYELSEETLEHCFIDDESNK